MKRAFVILAVVCIFVLILLHRRKKAETPNNSTVDEKPIIPHSTQPNTTPVAPPSTFKVQSIRLRARDGQPERAVVCSEVKLLMVGKWLRPISGSVTTVAPGHSGDWRRLDDDSNGSTSYVHTDITTPGNAIVLNYGGVEADGLVLWTRTDYLQSGADRMFNVDVEIVGDNNQIVWKKQLNSSLYSKEGMSYTLSFQNIRSD